MSSPFDNLKLHDIDQALRAATPDWVAENIAFYDGDHWQGGRGWVGPQLPPTSPAAALVVEEIRRAFTSRNMVASTVGRHVSAVVGRAPHWTLTVRRPLADGEEPTTEEQARIAETTAALTTWWTAQQAHKHVQDAATMLLLAARAMLRLYVPAGARDADGQVPQADLTASLARIALEHPQVGQAILLTHTRTGQQCAAYLYEEVAGEAGRITAPGADGRSKIAVGTAATQRFVELCYLDGEQTVLRIVGQDGTTRDETRTPLGSRLLSHALSGSVLTSEQVRQNQRQLNLARTLLSRNVVQGGFLERIILNAQLPVEKVADPSAPDGFRLVPRPLQIGPGKTAFISGEEITDPDTGELKGITSPSVVYRDPVAVDTFTNTEAAAEHAILEETRQLHALISGDATASGESRKQARADFETSLNPTQTAIEAATVWLLETVLALASYFAGEPDRYADLRATVQCRIDTGPQSAEDAAEIRADVEAKIISRETARSLRGIDDVDAEAARVATETEAAQQTLGNALLTSFDRGQVPQ